jgi:hypothetical protein
MGVPPQAGGGRTTASSIVTVAIISTMVIHKADTAHLSAS